MKHHERTQATRSAVLNAAARVITRDGPHHFRMEHVAAEAGISKGGLFYHYASRQALIAGLLEVTLSQFERRIEELCTARPGAYAQAFVHATLEAASSNTHQRTGAALLIAMTHHPELLSVYVERSRAWQARLEQDSPDPTWATIARLTAEGLYLAYLFGNESTYSAQRDQVLAQVLALTSTPAAGHVPRS